MPNAVLRLPSPVPRAALRVPRGRSSAVSAGYRSPRSRAKLPPFQAWQRRPSRSPSAGSSPSSSPIWSASPRCPSRATPRTRGSCSRVTSRSARTVIERYGGTVEKFIGDAVMAVWGAPVANEDDAERAVRAALELVAAVPELGPGLKARAGVLTGEAAVTLGAQGEGMVAGDLVNTASRVQSAAEPGTVLVGESTKRASEAAVAYEDAGSHELKGKSEPMPLWRAVRVVAGTRGAMRSSGLEAPFVGRDRELRLVKELFHGSADEQKAQLVSVTGIAGIGKSRLSWEFEKYIDGLARRRLLAPRPLPLLRRGRRLLGARGDGADALRHRRGRGAGLRAGEAARDGRGAHPRPGGAPLGRAAPRPPARARGGSRRRPGEPLLGLADPLRAARRALARRSSSSRTCSGPTRASSTSSSTCSSGREATRSTCSSSPAPNSSTSVLPGAPASATSPRCTSSRCRSSPWATC